MVSRMASEQRGNVRDFLEAAARRREGSATAEQMRHRALVASRTEKLQEGIRRGPNAHPDGTFGKVRKG